MCTSIFSKAGLVGRRGNKPVYFEYTSKFFHLNYSQIFPFSNSIWLFPFG